MSRAPVMAVNSGSSSLRLDLFDCSGEPRRLAQTKLSPAPAPSSSPIATFLADSGVTTLSAAVHRIVHGGPKLTETCLLEPAVEAEIGRLAPLAPLHNPGAIAWIQAVREAVGDTVPQLAAFDTAYFADLPAIAQSYALPWEVCEQHAIRRYGFHGLAHRAMVETWHDSDGAAGRGRRVISIQLGAGCSITASEDGRPVETSMGFSPLEGLVMSTRCGDLDAGIVLYLLREGGLTVDTLDSMLNDRAGLRGLSGVSGDMEALLASNAVKARHAVDVFCHRARKYLGAYLAVMGGADAVLFGGGVGEHAPAVRARILESFEWAGIDLDTEANTRAVGGQLAPVHADGGAVAVAVVPVDEASVLIRDAVTELRRHAACISSLRTEPQAPRETIDEHSEQD